jgi:predicted porin
MSKPTISKLLLAATALTFAGSIAHAQSLSDLEAQLNLLNAKVNHLQSLQTKPPAIAPGTPKPLKSDQNGSLLKFLNNPIMLYDDQNTSVHLYGLIEATLSDVNNQNDKGSLAVGFQTAWFSGNRWGIDADHVLGFGPSIGLPGLKIISKLESEFELPTGEFDTGNGIFNRDAWVGFESPDLGKLTFGRQNTLTRDFTQTWGDAYGTQDVGLKEGGFTNVNNFKQIIFYSGDPDGTRNNSSIVWKKKYGPHWVLGLGYSFGGGGAGGGSASENGVSAGGGTPGQFALGSSGAISIAYNELAIGPGVLQLDANYNRADNSGLTMQSELVGGDYVVGIYKVNAGYIHYTADQGVHNSVGTRTDNSWTISGSVTPITNTEVALGYVRLQGQHAGFGGGGNILIPFLQSTANVTKTANGGKGTIFGSVMYHADKQTDFYVAADYVKVDGGWSVGDAQGNIDGLGAGRAHNSEYELATGVRFKF